MVVRKLPKQCSVISRLRHYVKKPVQFQYYNTSCKQVSRYGLLFYGCTSKNRFKAFFLQKKMLGQICFKTRHYLSAELLDEFFGLNVHEFYIVELLKLFLKIVRSILPSDFVNSLCERELSNVQTRRTQLNLFLPDESGCVSRSSLRYRGAKLNNCVIETA